MTSRSVLCDVGTFRRYKGAVSAERETRVRECNDCTNTDKLLCQQGQRWTGEGSSVREGEMAGWKGGEGMGKRLGRGDGWGGGG